MTISHVFELLMVVAVASAIFSSWVQYRRNYNLWDWLKDKWLAFRGVLVHDAQVTIKLSSSEYHHLTSALDKVPASIRWAIRRR